MAFWWPVLFGEERAWESLLTRSVQSFKRWSSSGSIEANPGTDVTPAQLYSSSFNPKGNPLQVL